MTTTWTALAGDTSSFAIELSYLTDPDDHYYDADERISWGSITLWANGINITEHLEQGEVLRSAHWYLLQTIEWFVDNWDALFHEERLPLRNAGSDAASAMTRMLIQPLRLVRHDLDEFQRLELWQSWWGRHNIVESTSGGIFPDVYIRRWGDLSEISVGSDVAAGTPSHFRYQNLNVVCRVPVGVVAAAVYDVLERAVAELVRRQPSSDRLTSLSTALASLAEPGDARYMKRLAFLSGVDATLESDLEQFRVLWARVDEAFAKDVDPDAREIAVGHRQGGLIVETSPQVALLFGSLSPTIDEDDIQVLLRSLHASLAEPRFVDLPAVKLLALPAVSAGQEGSLYGEAAFAQLADSESSYVDVAQLLDRFGIMHSFDRLSDPNIRAVSLVTDRFGVHVVVNLNYLRGTTERVLRFTLAHELGHVLLDRSRSMQMAVVSGPWAPRAVEQRANAFAAALLMPEQLVARHLEEMGFPALDVKTVWRLAGLLRVSLSSLADRLYNLMLLSREEADALTTPGTDV